MNNRTSATSLPRRSPGGLFGHPGDESRGEIETPYRMSFSLPAMDSIEEVQHSVLIGDKVGG